MNHYRHQLAESIVCPDSLGKIVCVGRNYADHAKELNNPVPSQPLLFIKPATAAVAMADSIQLPEGRGACHHELELALLIGKPLKNAGLVEARQAVVGIGLALDLTLRELQDKLKQKGHPWERAKAFDNSCPLSAFVSADDINLQALDLELYRNGQLQQRGNTASMLFSVDSLLAEISANFSLLPGDVVLTGTPAGVGPLHSGDDLKARLGTLLEIETKVL